MILGGPPRPPRGGARGPPGRRRRRGGSRGRGRGAPRVGQLKPNTPVDVLARGVAMRSAENARASDTPRKEDWLLVRARTGKGAEIAGWVVASFINLDLPDPLPAYATSAGMSPVAFFPLRTVEDPQSGPKPYYLVAGTSGPQGQPCDFTMLRVYTWSTVKQRYETAFVQNNLCGHLPIRVERDADPQHDALFSFDDSASGPRQLTYRMRNTIVRLLRSPSATQDAKNAHAPGARTARR